MGFLNEIYTAINTVKNVYTKIELKGGEHINDSSKNTSFLADTIRTIQNSVIIDDPLNVSYTVNKNTSTYINTLSSGHCVSTMNIDFQVSNNNIANVNIDDYTIEVGGTFNSSSDSVYFADNVITNIQTQYYKQLEFLNTSVSCPFPRINAYTVIMGFKCKEITSESETFVTINDENDNFCKAYGIACLLSNVNNTINQAEYLKNGKISYNYIDYILNNDVVTEISYGTEYGCNYFSLFKDCVLLTDINNKEDIINIIGPALADATAIVNGETSENNIKTYMEDHRITNSYKLRIYYNINLIINDSQCYTDNIFIPFDYNIDRDNLRNMRHLSITNNINNSDIILDPIDETNVRLSNLFNPISFTTI